jgi:hypothetical protein
VYKEQEKKKAGRKGVTKVVIRGEGWMKIFRQLGEKIHQLLGRTEITSYMVLQLQTIEREE